MTTTPTTTMVVSSGSTSPRYWSVGVHPTRVALAVFVAHCSRRRRCSNAPESSDGSVVVVPRVTADRVVLGPTIHRIHRKWVVLPVGRLFYPYYVTVSIIRDWYALVQTVAYDRFGEVTNPFLAYPRTRPFGGGGYLVCCTICVLGKPRLANSWMLDNWLCRWPCLVFIFFKSFALTRKVLLYAVLSCSM